ncbi:UNVERIFIED_CONTAM: hypothetical protein ABID98_000634 [Brevibacillus sp. OAP136]
MEFPLDVSLLLLALGLSGYLVAHLFCAHEVPNRLAACWIYPVHERMPTIPLIRFTSSPKMLRVRRKLPLQKASRSTDEERSLFCMT